MLSLVAALPAFFRERVTLQQAEEQIKRLLETRDERFLELVRLEIYERPGTPYRRLLKFAGCEYSDLRAAVGHHGLDRTLERLAGEGVYLTSDEYKGKKEIVRGGLSFRVDPSDFANRQSSPGFSIRSSGTSNKPVGTFTAIDWIATRALGTSIFYEAHGLFNFSHALYDAILPASSLNHLLTNVHLGKKTDRWFARKIPFNSRLDRYYHALLTNLIVYLGRIFADGIPKPRFDDVDEIQPILNWVLEQKRQGSNCYIITVASSAARISRAAVEKGVSLEGTQFNVAGEPFTVAKEKAVKKAGAIAVSRYSYGNGIPVGYGCANPAFRDDVHVNQHLLAVTPHPKPLSNDGADIHPVLLTTLHPAAPRLLLNTANGDYVTLDERDCGCALGKAGLRQHLHHIGSFEKLTSEGMNYYYGDLYELFEVTFPAEFGGGPGDYQLLEEEDHDGQTRLTLLVHPKIGDLDADKLLARLQQALAQDSRNHRFMTRVWQDAGTFRVRREVPYTSPRGKILPLHIPH
ncbi:MAG: hypothetical protein OEN50_02460 [Deltaproteobacteria bacterium]|nr:hypothetical protein [Deltaproteobacteria bacterium]